MDPTSQRSGKVMNVLFVRSMDLSTVKWLILFEVTLDMELDVRKRCVVPAGMPDGMEDRPSLL